MPSSEIDAIRALLTAKARPVGWAQRRERLGGQGGPPPAGRGGGRGGGAAGRDRLGLAGGR